MRRIDQLRFEKGRLPRRRRSAQTKVGTLGLILGVLLILTFTISRSWPVFHWSGR